VRVDDVGLESLHGLADAEQGTVLTQTDVREPLNLT